jgi:hypothetical protein
MAQKTAKQIQEEANRLFGKGASDKKFEWRRQQQAEAGLEQEKKTRGGVAGTYDRNKKLIGTAATAAGYMFGGPAGAAVVRGTMQGLDRPGKGGIGFDLGRAAKGAMEGYSAGKLAGGLQSMGAGLKQSFMPKGGIPKLPANAPMIDTPLPKSIVDMGANVGGGVSSAGPSMTQRLGAGAMDLVRGAGEKASGAFDYLKKRPEIAATALTTVSGARQAAANRRLQEQQLAQNQSQFEQEFGLRKGEQEREVERQRRIAQLLAPLFQRISGGQG